MKFLLDQGLPRSTVSVLAKRGLDAEHVGDLGMTTAGDEEILQAGLSRNAVIATLDSDFHAILAASHANGPSVVRIRIEGMRAEDVAKLLERVVSAASAELEAGAAVTVTPSGIRIRLLPLA